MTLKLCENMSQIGPLHHEIHALKVGQFCTPGCTPGVQVATYSIVIVIACNNYLMHIYSRFRIPLAPTMLHLA